MGVAVSAVGSIPDLHCLIKASGGDASAIGHTCPPDREPYLAFTDRFFGNNQGGKPIEKEVERMVVVRMRMDSPSPVVAVKKDDRNVSTIPKGYVFVLHSK